MLFFNDSWKIWYFYLHLRVDEHFSVIEKILWCESLFASDRKDGCRVCAGGDCRVRETVEILYPLRDEGDSGCTEHEEYE